MRKSTSTLLCGALATMVLAGSPGQAQQARTSAQAHLEKARALLQSVPTKNFSTDGDDDEDASEEVVRLRRQFDELVKAFEASLETSTEVGWKLKFSEVERTLARLIGGGAIVGTVKAGAAVVVQSAPKTNVPATGTGAVEVPAGGVPTPASNPASASPSPSPNAVPPSAGTVVTTPQTGGATTTDPAPVPVGTSGTAGASSGATGTSGTASGTAAGDAGAVAAAKVSTIGIKRLNTDVRRQLEMFRTEIELFYVAPVGERTADPR